MSKDATPLIRPRAETPARPACATARLRDGASGARRLAVRVLVALVCSLVSVPKVRASQVDLPQPDPCQGVVIAADAANRWIEGVYEVWHLRGKCTITQGYTTARSNEAMLWIERASPAQEQPSKVIAYLEGDVAIQFKRDGARSRLTDRSWLGRFLTDGEVIVHAGRVEGEPEAKPAIYGRAMARRRGRSVVRQAQYAEAVPSSPPIADESLPPGSRRIQAWPRSEVPYEARWMQNDQTGEWIGIIDLGITLRIDGLKPVEGLPPGLQPSGMVDISTDRMVIWTSGLEKLDLSGVSLQSQDVPLEIYMEGNIVFREGERVIYADRMYYDVRRRIGIVLDAEILTPVDGYEGLLRLKADFVQQVAPDRFFARDAYLTSSRLGRPGYRVQIGEAFYEDRQQPVFDPITGLPAVTPEGDQVYHHEQLAVGRDNVLFLGELPVLYLPRLATDLSDPSYYIRRARIKNDSVFGTQVLTDWNAYQVFGIQQPPEGTKWDLSLDYLSDRGLGHGTTFTYERDRFLGLEGPNGGLADFWGIQDHGLDNLGRTWRSLVPEKDYRYRLLWRHRQLLPGDFELKAEAGWISDRNFLNQYYEEEWDDLKDESTGFELKRRRDIVSWSVSADARLNSFFTQTEWLPRGDHFWLGQPLLGGWLTWYEHSSVGYARLLVTSTPEDPAQAAQFALLPWEQQSIGERAVTTHEIDLPLQLGAVKVVPYALGQLGHWGEDLTGQDIQRFYYQTGVRASMPMWKAYPEIESQLFNVHGVAHKVVFDAEFSFAEANQSLGDFPLYDALDDDSIEAFRRRFPFTAFGAPPLPWTLENPWRFDERYYALRTGLAGWVTSPSAEVADDLTALRFGVRQRWQTKRGAPGGLRIIDWITLDTHATYFPKADRDNFGTSLGLVDYAFSWHVGDRLTLLSDGIFDFFDDGQKTFSVGGFLNRPPRGGLYLGMRVLEGPISSRVLSLSYNYRMSEKWVSSFGMSVDLGNQGNIGQNFRITRIGESLLVSAGLTVDASRDNVGFNLAIEPRFLPKTRLGRMGGARIPVAGAFGLE